VAGEGDVAMTKTTWQAQMRNLGTTPERVELSEEQSRNG
jgi:hypothetical protein